MRLCERSVEHEAAHLDLALLEHRRHHLRREQAGQAEELLVLVGQVVEVTVAGVRGAAVEHVRELGLRLERLELEVESRRGLRRLGDVERRRAGRRRRLRRRDDVVALLLQRGGEREQRAHGGQEQRRALVRGGARARSDRRPGRRTAASGTTSPTRRRPGAGCRRPRTPCARRRSSAAVPRGELVDLLRGLRVVGEHDDGLLAADRLDDRGVRARGVLVGGEHHRAGVGHARGADLAEPLVGRGDDVRHPLAASGRARCARRRSPRPWSPGSDRFAESTSPAEFCQRATPE